MNKRIYTGLGLGIVMITCLLLHLTSAIALLIIVALFSCLEWSRSFLPLNRFRNAFVIIGMLTLLLAIAYGMTNDDNTISLIYVSCALICCMLVVVYFFILINRISVRILSNALSGFIYIVLATICCIYFLKEDFEIRRWLILSCIAVNWSNDTMAYFIGRAIGATPLAPSISPNKTIEGSLGGLIFGVICLYVLNNKLDLQLHFMSVIFIGVALVISGSLGDLFESSLKRLAGLKDSGKILPGHGGFLDRFDSFYFVIPVGILLFHYFQN